MTILPAAALRPDGVFLMQEVAGTGADALRLAAGRAPDLVVLDEPTSALDRSVLTPNELFFVRSHLPTPDPKTRDWRLSVSGRVVEAGPTEQVFTAPRHAYTRVLLSAIPFPDPDRKMNPLRVSDLSPQQLEPLPDACAQLYD